MKIRNYIIITTLLLFSANFNAQPLPDAENIPITLTEAAPQKNSIFNEMQYTELLTLNLTLDIDLLIEQKKKDEYQPASITFKNSGGSQIQQRVKVKARGKSRRRICDFPPIKIKFKKDQLEASGLNREFNEYKLVTHCSEEGESEENLLKEFLAYKIYNELTDASFRVQLVKINYIDTKTAETKYIRYGFLLEDNEEMSSRLDGEITKVYNLQGTDLNSYQFNLMAFFQYMIGNTDWDLSVMRNVKIVASTNKDYAMIVPYDFDFSGLVNTKYARPNSVLPQLNVRDRVFQGHCLNDSELNTLILDIKQKKENIKYLIEEFKYLPKKERKDIKNYLDSFFEILDNPATLKMELNWNCELEK